MATYGDEQWAPASRRQQVTHTSARPPHAGPAAANTTDTTCRRRVLFSELLLLPHMASAFVRQPFAPVRNILLPSGSPEATASGCDEKVLRVSSPPIPCTENCKTALFDASLQIDPGPSLPLVGFQLQQLPCR